MSRFKVNFVRLQMIVLISGLLLLVGCASVLPENERPAVPDTAGAVAPQSEVELNEAAAAVRLFVVDHRSCSCRRRISRLSWM